MSRAERVAAGALGAAALSIALLPALLPLDELVYRWLQFTRGCGTHALAEGVDRAVRLGIGLQAALVLLTARRRRMRGLAGAALVVAGGAALGELLKTAIERLRPRSLPIVMMTGNSFPSGHVMNTTLFVLSACLLAREGGAPRWSRRLVDAGAVVCVGAQIAARLLRGSHWASDMPGSVLLGVAWVLGAGVVWRLGRGAAVAAAALAASLYLFFYDVPAARLHLPSALDAAPASVAALAIDEPRVQAALAGEWSMGIHDRLGSVAWARSDHASIELADDSGAAAIVRMTLRVRCGHAEGSDCARVVASVNGWTAPEFAVTCGWREYHLEPPSGVLHRGANVVAFDVRHDARACSPTADCARIGLGSARLYAEPGRAGESGAARHALSPPGGAPRWSGLGVLRRRS